MKKTLSTIFFLLLTAKNTFALTLTEALVHTYNNNPELIAEREKVKETDEQKFQAISTFLPQLNYVVKKTITKQDKSISQSPTGSNLEYSYQPWKKSSVKDSSIQLQQNLFNGGGSLIALKQAQYIVEQARAALKETEQQVLFEAIRSYSQVIVYKKVLDLAQDNLEANRGYVPVVRERFEAGLVTKSDVALTEANLATATSQFVEFEGLYTNALSSFKKNIGLEAENLAPIIITDLPPNLQKTIEEALKNNPSIEKAKSAELAANYGVKARYTKMLPTVNLTGSIARSREMDYAYNSTTNNSNYTGGVSPATLNSPVHSKTIAVTMNVPIYQAGDEYSNIREASAKLAQAKQGYRRTIDFVRNAATEAWNGYESQKAAFNSYQDAEVAYKLALDGLIREYQEGIRVLYDLLDARDKYFRTQINLCKTEDQVTISAYKLIASVGKLNAKDLKLPTKIYDPAVNYNKLSYKFVGFK